MWSFVRWCPTQVQLAYTWGDMWTVYGNYANPELDGVRQRLEVARVHNPRNNAYTHPNAALTAFLAVRVHRLIREKASAAGYVKPSEWAFRGLARERNGGAEWTAGQERTYPGWSVKPPCTRCALLPQ